MLNAIVGLGTNLGDRLASLRAAVEAIAARARVVAISPVYETAPVGGPQQGDFLNAAIRVEWPGDALSLLDALLAIERGLGRVRDPSLRWGPRTLDLDVLWIDGVTLASDRLTVPHPRLRERAFALLPLLDVAPELAGELGCEVDTSGVTKTAVVLTSPR